MPSDLSTARATHSTTMCLSAHNRPAKEVAAAARAARTRVNGTTKWTRAVVDAFADLLQLLLAVSDFLERCFELRLPHHSGLRAHSSVSARPRPALDPGAGAAPRDLAGDRFSLCQHPLFPQDVGWQHRIFESGDLLLIPLILLLPLLDLVVRRLAGRGQARRRRPGPVRRPASRADGPTPSGGRARRPWWPPRSATCWSSASTTRCSPPGRFSSSRTAPKLAALRAMQDAHPSIGWSPAAAPASTARF